MGKSEAVLGSPAARLGESGVIRLIVFDLDGTLIDSSRDLAISTNATRAHFGLPPISQDLVNSYVGNGAPVLVRRAMGPDASEEQVAEALAFFLQYYREHSLEHTRLYSGVREAIEQLSVEGRKLAVLTNKPEKISGDILSALGVRPLFFRVVGGNTFPEKKPNPVGLLAIAAEAQLPPDQLLMVGDSAVDVATARNAGAQSCGVLWGFQPETFAAVPPDFTIAQPGELTAILR
ncbi:MAG TPA: HAD-IA family hydrolase [Bryobacteraceae bacterium]|jgi:phosphoglycolate phosphatase|nr:HAD-IA family hydrolase [Bryobacteraceae bacterium]